MRLIQSGAERENVQFCSAPNWNETLFPTPTTGDINRLLPYLPVDTTAVVKHTHAEMPADIAAGSRLN